jgi:predicted Rossmann fold nucleotide-binding protein DprA/Smf involved in DNA uptake
MRSAATRGVCHRCARRSWLLAQLAAALDRTARDPARLWPALTLGDEELIDALGGRRRDALRDAWRQWSPGLRNRGERRSPSRGAVCRHHCAYPSRLAADPLAPHALVVTGEVERLCDAGRRAVVAFAGPATPSGYGVRSARALARDLAAGEVTVACVDDDLGAYASEAAIDAGGHAIVVGAGVASRTSARRDAGALAPAGKAECRVAELLLGDCSSSWPRLAGQRTLALLADLVVVVEAEESAASEAGREPACIEIARRHGTRLAAVPGPIDSRLSQGANALIDEGALVARDAPRLLDALADVRVDADAGGRRRERRKPGRRRRARPGRSRAIAGTSPQGPEPGQKPPPERAAATLGRPVLEPRLTRVLERVRGGEDTLAKLCAGETACEAFAVSLTELELLGALRRAPDGSYIADPAHLA